MVGSPRGVATQRPQCRAHRLTETTFNRWLRSIDASQTARTAAELLREQRRLRRRGGPATLCKSKRSVAVQAFWAMHVEALAWSGMAAAPHAAAHHISAISLRRWRDLLESGEVEVDRRARLHPSARAQISSGLSNDDAREALTGVRSALEPAQLHRRGTIVLEAERPDVTVAAICRHHGIVTSMVSVGASSSDTRRRNARSWRR